jgi:hypothetical protein
VKARAIVYNMEDYLRNTVTRYCELRRGLTGKAPTLKQVSTPFLHEDHRDAPAAMPRSEGHASICPWCRRSFAEPGTVPEAKRAKKKRALATRRATLRVRAHRTGDASNRLLPQS